jgi:hypothetical protein
VAEINSGLSLMSKTAVKDRTAGAVNSPVKKANSAAFNSAQRLRKEWHSCQEKKQN